MRKGFNPTMVLDPKGRLVCIATGADATSEHEGGSDELQEALTGVPAARARNVGELRRRNPAHAIPDLMHAKRLRQRLDDIVYAEREVKSEPQAGFVFTAGNHSLQPFGDEWVDRELSFAVFSEPKDIAGAWDSRSMGFKARGATKVAQLREFVQAIKEGQGIFAGTFWPETGLLRGVILAREDLLDPEHRAAMVQAQVRFEQDVELHARSRVDELSCLMHRLPAHRPAGRIWPVWKGGVAGGELAYALNPGFGVKAQYYGPYAFEQLRDWLAGGASAALVPA